MKLETRHSQSGPDERKESVVFTVFCLWSLVLLCRPQDYFTELEYLHPNLLLTVLTLILFVFFPQKNQGPSLLAEKQVRYYLALFAIMVVGIPASLYARLSFNTIFTEYIVFIVYVLIFYKVVDSLEKLLTVLMLGCLGSGLYFIVSLSSGLTASGRLSYGHMFDPNDLAYFALVFLPLNLLFVGREHPLWIRLSCLTAFSAGTLLIMLSGSRGGLLAFIAALLVLFFMTKAVKPSVKLLVLLVGIVLVVNAPINYERYSSILDYKNDYNSFAEEGRLSIWRIGMRTLSSYPLTGVGVNNSSYAVALDRERRGLDRVRWQPIHNSVIQIGAETGVAGLAVFVLMCVGVVRVFYRVKSTSKDDRLIRTAEMGTVGFVGMLTAAMFLSQAYSVYLAFYVVFSASVNRLITREQLVGQGVHSHG